MTTGERMKLRRKELGLSAEYVAEQLGLSASTIYRYEKGDIEKLPIDVLRPLSWVLRTTPSCLMGLSSLEDDVPLSYSIGHLFTDSERELVLAYRAASEDDRAIVDLALAKYRKKVTTELA